MNFITTNLATCIEINGQGLTNFLHECREIGRPELFLPFLLNSQHSESAFRSWRSIFTVRSTKVNLDIKEVEERSTRLQVMEEAPTTIADFYMVTKKQKGQFIPESLLSDEEISAIARDGFESAGETLAKFSKFYC